MAYRSLPSCVCSNSFTLFISNDETVLSLGSSDKGATGHEEEVLSPKQISSLQHIKSVAVGREHSICLDYDGNVFTFGNNQCGQLGIGVDRNTLQQTHVPQKVNLPPCKQISAGESFNVCLSKDGLLYSFGFNYDGRLGLGDDIYSYDSPQNIPSLKDIEFVECGNHFTICKTQTNDVFSWGLNDYGQLANGKLGENQFSPGNCIEIPDGIVDIKCGCDFVLLLTEKKEVFACGNNENCQIGRETESYYSATFHKIEDLFDIIRIECSQSHSMCIDTNNNLFVFGFNRYGQLGLGHISSSSTPIKNPSLSNIIDVSTGGTYSFVKTLSNEIFAFGDNKNSQLGVTTNDETRATLKQLYKGSRDVYEPTPIRVFENNEDIWCSNINTKSIAKSARK